MTKEVVLLPCPFCGEKAETYRVSGSYGYYSAKDGVRCSNKKCGVHPSVSFDDEGYDWEKRRHIVVPALALASAAWNTRA